MWKEVLLVVVLILLLILGFADRKDIQMYAKTNTSRVKRVLFRPSNLINNIPEKFATTTIIPDRGGFQYTPDTPLLYEDTVNKKPTIEELAKMYSEQNGIQNSIELSKCFELNTPKDTTIRVKNKLKSYEKELEQYYKPNNVGFVF